MNIGDTWNESECYEDPLTGRRVRRLTREGRINQTPTYHTNSGFTSDGRYSVFASVREGRTWIIAAEVATGDLKALWRAAGIGDRSYIHRGMSLEFPDVDGRGICGNRVCVAPRSGLAVFAVEKKIVAVDINTCEPRVLVEDCGDEWIYGAPCVSPDEKYVGMALSSSHPEMRGGWTLAPQKHYRDYLHRLRLVRVPLDGSAKPETIYEHPEPAQSAHCAYCPADAGLLYFDLDLPPHYWAGGDGRTPRIWLLDVNAGTIRPLTDRYPGAFQTHQAWLWDGSAMCYHGSAEGGGEYFGIASPDGEVLWERVFRQASAYGHNTPDARKNALIIDGIFSVECDSARHGVGAPQMSREVPTCGTPMPGRSGRKADALQWLYWDDSPRETPKLEPICLHSTEWGGLPGQYSHPHPLTDASGRWISFTSARGGRSDVYVVRVDP